MIIRRIKQTCRKCGHKQNVTRQDGYDQWICGVCFHKNKVVRR